MTAPEALFRDIAVKTSDSRIRRIGVADPPGSFSALLTAVATTFLGGSLTFYDCGVGANFA